MVSLKPSALILKPYTLEQLRAEGLFFHDRGTKTLKLSKIDQGFGFRGLGFRGISRMINL